MQQRAILATLGYVLSPDQSQVLMVHRNRRPGDEHAGKYNGLGGKLAPGENLAACMTREIHEEANLAVTAMHLRGTMYWPGFGKNGEDWLALLFLITAFDGSAPTSNAEGDLEWIPRHRLLDLPLWEGDRQFLPLVFDNDPRPFHGVMPYHEGRMLSWHYSRV